MKDKERTVPGAKRKKNASRRRQEDRKTLAQEGANTELLLGRRAGTFYRSRALFFAGMPSSHSKL